MSPSSNYPGARKEQERDVLCLKLETKKVKLQNCDRSDENKSDIVFICSGTGAKMEIATIMEKDFKLEAILPSF